MNLVRPFQQLPPIAAIDSNPNFTSSVFLENLFDKNEVARIRSLYNEDIEKEAKIGANRINKDIRSTKVIFLDVENNEWIYDKLSAAVIMVNMNRYRFEIKGFQSKLQLAIYRPGDFYGWHMDMGKNNSTRKLSISVQLSDADEYEGGELQFLKHNQTVDAPKVKGAAIIFPSFVAHRVQPVTAGCRLSIVGWIAGSPFR